MTIASLSKVLPLECKYSVLKKNPTPHLVAFKMPFAELVKEFNEDIVLEIAPTDVPTEKASLFITIK